MSLDERRSPVEDRLVLMPMHIKIQREGAAFIAAMPAWMLPVGLFAEGASLEDALEELDVMMREYWSR